MCGILGALGDFNEDHFKESLAMIFHRGPDGNGTYASNDKNLLLGHTRLSIIDTSDNGSQPMTSACGNYIIIFNGEIYNFRTLASKYLPKEFTLLGGSDTEVFLELFSHHGTKVLSELDGIFAAAVFSKPENKIYLIRDRFGVKPLYYHLGKKSLIFASETGPIIKLLKDKLEFSSDALINSFKYLWNPDDESYIKGIYKHKAGYYSSIDLESFKIIENSFSDLPLISHYKEKKTKSLNRSNLIDKTRGLLRQSVYDQMISDVPIGSFLSGGLDSSAIAFFANEINPSLDYFTIRTQGQEHEGFEDDLPYAKLVSEKLNLKLNILDITPDKIIDSIQEMVKIMNEPISDPAIFNTYLISSFAKENGIKVLLSGVGGDDLFTGYRRHQALKLSRILKYMPLNLLRRLPLNDSLKRRISKLHYHKTEKYKLSNFFHWIERSDHLNIINQEFHEQAIKKDALDEYSIEMLDTCSDRIDKMLLLEQRFFLREHNLHYTDLMSMAAGVEVRVPFLSNDLSNFAASIPGNYQQTFFNSKNILKKSMVGLLPREIIYRSKTGFGAPLRKWVKDDLFLFIQDTITPDALNKLEIFNTKSVIDLIQANKAGKIDASYTIFQILTLIIWQNTILNKDL